MDADKFIDIAYKCGYSTKAQKKLLVKVVVFSLIFSLFLGGIFLYGIKRDEGKIHHQVETIWEG